MINSLPLWISVLFILATFASVLFLYISIPKTNGKARNIVLFSAIVWLGFHALLTLNNVYSTDINALPPKIVTYGVALPILVIIVLFSTQQGRVFIDSLSLKYLTYLQSIRLPVELTLYGLFLYKSVPKIMTFEGGNWDILTGITAILVGYWLVTNVQKNRKLLIGWNLITLGLLINIIAVAPLTAPSPLQRLEFEQPNIAILYFPFSWLPTFVVPVVLFGHLVSLRQLIVKR